MPHSFKSYLITEGFVNLIGTDSESDREKYVDQAWDLLQKAYFKIGGIRGGGFNTKEDMIKNIPFWKVYLEGGKVAVVVMYKDRGGRKVVAIGTSGTPKSREILGKVVKESINVSYGEYSGPMIKFVLKSVGADALETFLLQPSRVEQLLDEKIIIPTETYVLENLEEIDQWSWKHYPSLRPYFYVRSIGGKPTLKLAVGSPDKKIR